MKYHTTTTLNEICACSPRKDFWEKLLAHLGKTKADDEPLELITILESNGLDDALWCLQVPSFERLSRHFQAWCAEQILPLFERDHPDDNRVRAQIEMLRNDNATDEERTAAWAAAWAAAIDGARAAARAAAWATAWATAWDAAWDAARAAAWAAAIDGARAAAWDAAWDAAMAAAIDAQEAKLRAMIGGEI